MNNMICRKLRSRKGKKYFYCSKQRTEIPLEEAGTVCAGCPLREYRQQTPLRKTPASARAKAVSISPKVKKVVYGRDHGTCIFCGAPGLPEMHVVPRSKGGLGVANNIVCACRECHRRADQTSDRADMIRFAISYLKFYDPDWTEESVIYRKGETPCPSKNLSALKLI